MSSWPSSSTRAGAALAALLAVLGAQAQPSTQAQPSAQVQPSAQAELVRAEPVEAPADPVMQRDSSASHSDPSTPALRASAQGERGGGDGGMDLDAGTPVQNLSASPPIHPARSERRVALFPLANWSGGRAALDG